MVCNNIYMTSPMIHICTGFNIPNFKNNKLLVRGRIITDPKKQKMMQEIIKLLKKVTPLQTPCELIIQFFVSDNRARDLDGMLCTVLDCLVRAGLIPDDNYKVIPKITISCTKSEKGSEGFDLSTIVCST